MLVTGGAGFIGSHVVDRLVKDDYDVSVVDNLSTGNLANISSHVDCGSVDFVNADVRDRDLVGKLVDSVDAVIHMAAVVSVPFSVEHPDVTFDVNVEGTRGLLESCVRSGVKKFIFISSCSVYGVPRYLPVDEAHPTCPTSPYAASKLEGERCCQELVGGSDVDVVVLRLFNVYGPRQASGDYSGVITKFIERAWNCEPLVVYGDGSQTRDFVHVTDVADAILALVKRQRVGDVFNIGYGRAVSINDLAKTVLGFSDCSCSIDYEPEREGDISHSVADSSKAREAFNYVPKVGLEEGLRDLYYHRSVTCGERA